MKERKVDKSRDYEKRNGAKSTHGLSGHSLYYCWLAMKRRCDVESDKGYPNYGGRGIKVCDEWYDVTVFYEWAINNGYQNGKELDRVDNNLGYSPDNCRFVTHFKNQRNRRNTKKIEYNGESRTLSEWAAILDVTISKLNYYINVKKMPVDLVLGGKLDFKKKWDIEKAKEDGHNIHKIIIELGFKKGWVVKKMNESGFDITASKFSDKLGGTRDFFTNAELAFIERLMAKYI